MKASDIQHGNPQIEGRYVVFVQCQAAQAKAWVEPTIMTWAGDRWHSTFIAQRNVLGWIGPLPVMKVADLKAPDMEYDL